MSIKNIIILSIAFILLLPIAFSACTGDNINTMDCGYKITISESRIINDYGCKKITNIGDTEIFVPTGSQAEWDAFVAAAQDRLSDKVTLEYNPSKYTACSGNNINTYDTCDQVTNTVACPSGQTCNGGSCVCSPDCTGKECGNDGCGGNCGTCLLGETCSSGTCVSTCTSHDYISCYNNDVYWYDSCNSREEKETECGSNSYGSWSCYDSDTRRRYVTYRGCSSGSCTSSGSYQDSDCLSGYECSGGSCISVSCTPNCAGKICGSDGCGGSCGTCSSGYTCSGGNCVSSCTNECTSGTGECSGNNKRTCGNYDADSCTEWSSWSYCGFGYTCSGGSCVFVCSNECTDGTTQCASSTSYKTCSTSHDSDVCTEWKTYSCGSGYVCSGGSCVKDYGTWSMTIYCLDTIQTPQCSSVPSVGSSCWPKGNYCWKNQLTGAPCSGLIDAARNRHKYTCS